MIDSLVSEFAHLWHRFWYVIPAGFVGLVSWSVWAVRWAISRRYRPLVNDYRTTTSVVVPVYREDPDVLVRCLESWRAERPDEIVLVVDLADVEVLSRLEEYEDRQVRVIPFKHRGKRSALGVGIRAARGEIVVLTDSDTSWEPGLLAAIQMPFADPAVGGVGSRQNVQGRATSFWRVAADWMVNIRYLDYVPAQGMAGAVACLSGRTAAYRRKVIAPLLPELEHESFLGRECNAGDDGRLTWLVLSSGYRTVYQGSARALSMFPCTLRAFVKQRVRWGRNSYRCYLTAMFRGWLWRQPFVTQLTVLQILLTPVSMACGLSFVAGAILHQQWGLVGLGVGTTLLGRAIRSISHLREHPEDLALLPLVTLVVIAISLPIKAWALVTMNVQGWLTRHSDSIAGEAQTERSLHGDTVRLRAPVRRYDAAGAGAATELEPVLTSCAGGAGDRE
ncbi:MAG TPA: glycosyltransferase family 2 protein [Candidatus Eisenbacteria bacterium]